METVWRLLKTLKIELPDDPAIPLSGAYPKEIHSVSWRDIGAPTGIIATSFTVAERWKELQMSTKRCMDKEHVVYRTMTYYSAMKRRKSSPVQHHGKTLRALCWGVYKPVTDGQIPHDAIYTKEVSKVVTLIEAQSTIVTVRGWEERKKESCCTMGIKFGSRKMKTHHVGDLGGSVGYAFRLSISAQVVISPFVSLSPTSGSALPARSLLGILSLSLSPSLSLCPSPAHARFQKK